jgi:hypothetical protein
MTKQEWRIIGKTESIIDNLKWIDEEEMLLKYSDEPIFEKQSLNNIIATFIYVDSVGEVVGVFKTTIDLETRQNLSIIHRSDFADKINTAKTPKMCVADSGIISEPSDWMEKSYIFDGAASYSIPVDHDNVDNFVPKRELTPFEFSKDTAKISSSLITFHDLYEIIIIMREETAVKKSILKKYTNTGKTKRVSISEDPPKQYVFSKKHPVSGKRRTKKNYI